LHLASLVFVLPLNSPRDPVYEERKKKKRKTERKRERERERERERR